MKLKIQTVIIYFYFPTFKPIKLLFLIRTTFKIIRHDDFKNEIVLIIEL